MPYQIFFDESLQLCKVELKGSVDASEIVEAVRTFARDDRWQQGTNTLWDGTRISELIIDWDEAQEVVTVLKELQPRLGPGKAAIVTYREVDLSMAQYFRHYISTEQRELKSFQSMAKARAWLEE